MPRAEVSLTWIDKAQWGPGPWEQEPDKVEWTDMATWLTCLAVRHKESGHWCGYVGVAKEHPLYGVDYDTPDVEVHGGLTFAEKCNESDKEHGVCHHGPEALWWFGFDCAHGGDVIPDFSRRDLSWHRQSEYRDLAYVRAECARLAKQLSEVAHAKG